MPSSPACTCLSCPADRRDAVAPCRAYPTSSITDAQWAVLAPLLPPPGNTTGKGGRPQKHSRRVILDAVFYLVRGGIAWRALPFGFPPATTVYDVFRGWVADGTWVRIHDALRDQVRVAAGRSPVPSAAVIDSQSVRAADTVPGRSRGYDAGKSTAANATSRWTPTNSCWPSW